jgi:hypothetical protein
MFNKFEYTGKMWNDLVDSMGSGWVAECVAGYGDRVDNYILTHKVTGKHLDIKLNSDIAALTDEGRVYFFDNVCDCWEDDEDGSCCYCEEDVLYSNWLVDVRVLDGFAACGCCYADEDEEVDGFLNVGTREDFETMLAALAVFDVLPPVVAELLADDVETLEQWKRVARYGRGVDVADADEVAALFAEVVA